MHFDWTTGPLAEGLHRYNTGLFWEAHESWEYLWRSAAEPDKTFLQGLIQVTAACHHLSRNNRLGASRLFTHALRRLDPYPSTFANISVEQLRTDIRDRLHQLTQGVHAAPLKPPRILPLCL